MGLRDFTIYSIIKRNANSLGNEIGWVFGPERITHGQFLNTVERLAYGLFEIGLTKGDRVAVLSFNSLEYMYLYGACAKLGAIMVPINWRLSAKEIEYVVSDARPKAIFVGTEFLEMIVSLVHK